MMKRPLLFLLIALLFCLGGCASKENVDASSVPAAAETATAQPAAENVDGVDLDLDDYDDYDEGSTVVDDPLEGWNRFWFGVNDWFIKNLLKPVHEGYAYVVPSGIRAGVSNFAHNLASPVRIINFILQGELAQAGVEFDRTLVNFMVSLGFADVASQNEPLFAYHPETADFDHTLATWGVPDGPYFIIPFMGPSTVRGTFGLTGDAFMRPQNYAFDWPVSISTDVYLRFNSADSLYKPYEQLTGSALEPYVALRSGYLSLRNARQQQLDAQASE